MASDNGEFEALKPQETTPSPAADTGAPSLDVNPPAVEYPPIAISLAYPPAVEYPPIALSLAYPPAVEYPPIALSQAYPPPAIGPADYMPIAQPNHIHLDASDPVVTVEEANYQPVTMCSKSSHLIPPARNHLTVLGIAAVRYSWLFATKSYEDSTRYLLPLLVTGRYLVEMPAHHSLASFTTQAELQQYCDDCSSRVYKYYKRVSSL